MSTMPTGVDPVFVEDVLFQCIYAVGRGAQMDVDRAALKELLAKIRPGFTTGLFDPASPIPGAPGAARWNQAKAFILSCGEAIGRLAAKKATEAGKYSIENTHMMDAYDVVRTSNAGGPGVFCPR